MNLAGSWESTLSEMLKRLWVLFFFLFSFFPLLFLVGRIHLWKEKALVGASEALILFID